MPAAALQIAADAAELPALREHRLVDPAGVLPSIPT
jgi:hypothetical protein